MLRAALSVVFVARGGQKLFGWFGGASAGIGGTTKFFTFLGIPSPHFFAYAVGLTELVGGLLFLAGLLTVIVSLAITIDMVVAIATATHKLGFFNGWELNLALIGMALALAVMGAGRCSVDSVLARRVRSRDPAASASPGSARRR